MPRSVLITGATGFLGMQVLDRVLEETDLPVLACVRASDQVAAQRRIADVLHTIGGDSARHAGRVRAVAADVERPRFGLDPLAWQRLARECEAIVHCAASVSFDLDLEAARAINVGGTRHVLALARLARGEGALERFVHVSTAYVAGTAAGDFGEADLDRGQGFRNTYEQTKLEAELILRDGMDQVGGVIVRPSIVVGERGRGWTCAFNVLYAPLKAYASGFIDVVPGRPDGVVDVVSADHVVDAIAHVLLHRRDVGGVLNVVAGDRATTVAELATMAAARFGRPTPTFGSAHPKLRDVLLPYFDVQARFDDARSRPILAAAGIAATPIGEYFADVVDYAEAAAWGQRPMTRAAAREELLPSAA
jgi:thioester reductase-like protein